VYEGGWGKSGTGCMLRPAASERVLLAFANSKIPETNGVHHQLRSAANGSSTYR